MTEQERIDGNIVISQFDNKLSKIINSTLLLSDDNGKTWYGKLYDEDWSSLMRVVENIEEIDMCGGIVRIVQGQCKITSRHAGDHSVYADESEYMIHGAKGKRLATWKAVVKYLKWYFETDCYKDKMRFKVGDKVKLPFNETGTIVKIQELIWASRYYVKIHKATMNKKNQTVEFLEKHLEHE